MISKGSGKREAKVCVEMKILSQTVFLEVRKRDIHTHRYIYINSIYIWKRPEQRNQHKLVRACAIPDRLTSEQSR